ncbi:hypothetical protein CDD81_4875 [Ophiocordyceps australis]|uniref:Uncharacterized protein n=1 Tax=Ophiocordyceps australis TaxID=1399860 RepID=A0A2C5XTG5_9HYPO|nr:hypothetical protein CDD81_4875 [Ophiocordyceps australis]
MKQSEQATSAASQRQLDVLLRSIVQFLDKGDLDKAARAFGLVLKLIDHKSHPLEIRNYNIWALGCEVLIRHSMLPEPQGRQCDDSLEIGNRDNVDIQRASGMPNIWGLSRNIRSIKTYFEMLKIQYPQHNPLHASANYSGYQLANLILDVYRIHAEHRLSLARIDLQQQKAGSIALESDDGDDSERRHSDSSRLLYDQRQELNRQTLVSINAVFQSLDMAEYGMPITMRQDFDRLKNVLSLYMKDLAVALSQ